MTVKKNDSKIDKPYFYGCGEKMYKEIQDMIKYYSENGWEIWRPVYKKRK